MGALGFMDLISDTLVLIFLKDCVCFSMSYQKLWKFVSILHTFKSSFKVGSPDAPLQVTWKMLTDVTLPKQSESLGVADRKRPQQTNSQSCTASPNSTVFPVSVKDASYWYKTHELCVCTCCRLQPMPVKAGFCKYMQTHKCRFYGTLWELIVNFCQAITKRNKLSQVSFSQMKALGDLLKWNILSFNTGNLKFCAFSSMRCKCFPQPAVRNAFHEAVNPSHGLLRRDFWDLRTII